MKQERQATCSVSLVFLFLGILFYGLNCLIDVLPFSKATPSLFLRPQLICPNFSAKSKKERRIALKAARKAALDPASRMVKIPYDRQTIDLPVAEAQDGRVELNGAGGERGWEKAQRAREELTQMMRSRRRKAIKESNFLKSMR